MSIGLYRSAAAFKAKTLDQLFRAGDLESEAARLRITHRTTPWKRQTVTLHHRPTSLSDYLTALAKRAEVQIDVERAGKLEPQRYVLRVKDGRAELSGTGRPDGVAELSQIDAARVRTGRTSFTIVSGECLFPVSGFSAERLPAKFASAYRLRELELPDLLEQTWFVLGQRS